ncbi:MAG TPA: hypothetical protein V6D15_05655 [Oculatellaceae cyanobacterium]|jgi:hypothetical protein
MEPVSLTAGAIAIATIILTKAVEKTGEKLGEAVLEKGGNLMKLLQHKSPETASALQVVAQRPELAEQQPEDYGVAVLEAKVEEAAKSDSEIAAAILNLAEMVKSQPQASQVIENWKGINIKGGNPNISNNTFNF